MVMYSKDIACIQGMNVGEFMDKNKDLIKRVFDEGINIMSYELSNNQMEKAVFVYLQSKYHPQSVLETEAYQPIKSN